MRAKIIGKSISLISRLSLKILGIEVLFKGDVSKLQGKLIISNHMSYLDVLCLASQFSTLFLTSVEIKNSFGLGHICRTSNCLFTERRKSKRSSDVVKAELSEIKFFLTNGLSLLIFPEGTSTNGEKILPYKTALFEPAIVEKIPVANLVLKYIKIDGEPFSEKNRDKVCWYGDMEFMVHLIQLAQLKKVQVNIELGSIFLNDALTRHELGKLAFEEAQTIYFRGSVTN